MIFPSTLNSARSALVTLGGAAILIAASAGVPAFATELSFNLFQSPAFAACFEAPGDTARVRATVDVGKEVDEMNLELTGFRPGLRFTVFTVENSNQLAGGGADPDFENFGLAWYQAAVNIGKNGNGKVKFSTILLNKVFGFDPAVGLAPTNTFHVGLWFNDPQDARRCGFKGFTPFNGAHKAGPLALITRPNGRTGRGPLGPQPAADPDLADAGQAGDGRQADRSE